MPQIEGCPWSMGSCVMLVSESKRSCVASNLQLPPPPPPNGAIQSSCGGVGRDRKVVEKQG